MNETRPVPQEHPTFDLLRRGVPLSLLCDLALPLDSSAVLSAEPADVSWLPVALSA